MESTFELHLLDYIAFFGYFALLSLIGYLAGRKKSKDASDYFLAGRSLPWYTVGSSYIAANISTEHFIGLIGSAVIYGICVATGEWSTVIAFTFLIWLFIPYLFSSKVYTAPEFLEKRFNFPMRVTFAAVTLIINVVAFLGPVIYGGSFILTEYIPFFEGKENLAIVAIAILSGFWAIWGGLKSIASMDLVTIAIMVFGGLSVTFLGFWHLGDGDGLVAGFNQMVEVNKGNVEWARDWMDQHVDSMMVGAVEGDHYNRLQVLQPANHKITSWVHWAFSFFYIGLWYTVINQHMIQKVLAAKDMYHARMGMVFASFLKLLLPFFVVIPGMIYFAMKPDFLFTQDFDQINDSVNSTYVVMIKELVPVFMVGVLVAALFGAIQSTVCSVLNSTSTVFTIDFYKMFIRKDASEREEVLVGRIAGCVILALSIGVAIMLKSGSWNLFEFIQILYIFFAPPFSATFLLGALWRRVSGFDAMLATVVSLLFATIMKILLGLDMLPEVLQPFIMQGLLVWVVAMVVTIVSALITPPPAPEKVSDDLTFNFKKMDFGGGLGDKWYNSVVLWWAIALFGMFAMVAFFSVFL
ncbi:SLC5 family protein [Pelagicoccus mobilis]|uniref:Sodium/solute symporter n=1 Tax=Pelagicoccus mobilis TaxID=415221 RepID=A0A934S4F8_9BACT|nr:sodium/solute symporter [Pelagicoccus mobilis]MBK1879174.1 sodium/solute symporter [Pelagicoccus mobilis]